MQYRIFVPRALPWTAPLCFIIAILANGCIGWIELPPVTARATVVSGAAFGPTENRPAGETLSKAVMIEGLTCNLPDRNALESMVRDYAPDYVGGLIQLRHVYLDEVIISATQGNFSALTSLSLFYVTVGGKGVKLAYLGGAVAIEGFGQTISLVPADTVDLLKLMEGQLCGAVIVAADGVTPDETIVFDAEAVLTVRAAVGL